MTQIEKTAIQQAEKQLEQDRKEKLQREVYDYLKGELDAIDEIEQRVRKLETEKRAHEENIKNIKQGNLEAIEKRRIQFPYTYFVPPSLTKTTFITSSGTSFYNNAVAGVTYTTGSGKTYIF